MPLACVISLASETQGQIVCARCEVVLSTVDVGGYPLLHDVANHTKYQVFNAGGTGIQKV